MLEGASNSWMGFICFFHHKARRGACTQSVGVCSDYGAAPCAFNQTSSAKGRTLSRTFIRSVRIKATPNPVEFYALS